MTNKERMEDILEDFYCFRDYEILPVSQFRTVNEIGVHRLVDVENMWYDIDQAIETFQRDGYPTIYFYVEEQNLDNVVNSSEYKASKAV